MICNFNEREHTYDVLKVLLAILKKSHLKYIYIYSNVSSKNKNCIHNVIEDRKPISLEVNKDLLKYHIMDISFFLNVCNSIPYCSMIH